MSGWGVIPFCCPQRPRAEKKTGKPGKLRKYEKAEREARFRLGYLFGRTSGGVKSVNVVQGISMKKYKGWKD